jgi:hypothetical protein
MEVISGLRAQPAHTIATPVALAIKTSVGLVFMAISYHPLRADVTTARCSLRTTRRTYVLQQP